MGLLTSDLAVKSLRLLPELVRSVTLHLINDPLVLLFQVNVGTTRLRKHLFVGALLVFIGGVSLLELVGNFHKSQLQVLLLLF